jgi:UDP-apiose/xylose synthase
MSDAITILGCDGFIGSHLLEYFLANGNKTIYGFDQDTRRISHIVKSDKRFQFFQGDIYLSPDLDRCINDSEVVISLAALCNPSLYNTLPVDVIESNFNNPVKIVKMCTKYKKWLIHFSTSEVYGKTEASLHCDSYDLHCSDVIMKEDQSQLILGPVSAQRWSYAAAKQLLERYIFAHAIQYGLHYTIIRPFNFIGPTMDFIPGVDGDGVPRVLACFMDSLLNKKDLCLVDEGKNKRVFTYINDAVNAVKLIIDNKQNSVGHIFNIGNPQNECTIKELALLIIGIYQHLYPDCDKSLLNVKHVTAESFYGAGYEDSDRRYPDISKIQKATGWVPAVDLKTALTETMKAYMKKYASR